MDRRYLILGAGILVSLVALFGLQLLNTAPETIDSKAGSESSTTDPNASERTENTPIPLPPLAEWKANQLTLRPGTKADSVNLTEDTTESWRNMEVAVTLRPSAPLALTTTLRADKKRRMLVFVYSGGNRLRCIVDPRTGQTNAAVRGRAENVGCTAAAKADGWWDVGLSGFLDPTLNEATQSIVAIAMASQRSEEAYRGDGQSKTEVADADLLQ